MTDGNDEPCMCGTDFTCMADDHDYEVARITPGRADLRLPEPAPPKPAPIVRGAYARRGR